MTRIKMMREIEMPAVFQVKRMTRKPVHLNLRSMRSPNLRMLSPPTSLLSCKKRKLAMGAARKISY